MRCIHCGKAIPDGSLFCTYCGKKLFDEDSVASAKTHAKDAEKSKKTKQIGKKAVVIAAVSAVAMILVPFCIYASSYLKAESYADDGDFIKAGESLLLPQLTRLHDAKLCAYVEAGLKFADGEYDAAWEGFASLHGYKSADIMLMETDYQQAAQMLAANDFDGAEKKYLLLAAAGYKDSSVMVKECQCLRGLWLLEQGDYFGAYEALTALDGYAPAADGIEQLKEQMYAEGQRLYHSGEYNDAEKYFSFLAPYEDSEKYLTLIEAHMPSSVFYSEKIVGELILIFEFEDAAELLVSRSNLAETFISGYWMTLDRNYFVESDGKGNSDTCLCYTNIPEAYDPTVPLNMYPDNYVESMYFDVKDGVFYFKDNPMLKVTVINANCMSWYSYNNGAIYTLYRVG